MNIDEFHFSSVIVYLVPRYILLSSINFLKAGGGQHRLIATTASPYRHLTSPPRVSLCRERLTELLDVGAGEPHRARFAEPSMAGASVGGRKHAPVRRT